MKYFTLRDYRLTCTGLQGSLWNGTLPVPDGTNRIGEPTTARPANRAAESK